jgi:REP element-mobilizing transposase RayT
MSDSHEKIYSRRDSLRLEGFDYSWPRVYFVTIVAQDRQARFLDERVANATIESLRKLRDDFDGKLWQRQFFDHIIRNHQDFEETLEYIRMTPVRRGLVKNPADWPYTERLDYLR